MKKDNLEAIYPLSPMQEGMLFHSLYAPQLEVYFEQFAYTLHGNLDVPAFKAAWQRVVAQHPVLRTLFMWENLERPLQVVLKQVDLSWSEHDWRGFPASEHDERVQHAGDRQMVAHAKIEIIHFVMGCGHGSNGGPRETSP